MAIPTEKLHLDGETVSVCDLRVAGAHAYMEHPTTDVATVCWRIGNNPGQVWYPGDPVPDEIVAHVAAGGLIAAWNAQFEEALWRVILAPRYGWPQVKPEQFVCTMAKAAYWGLPMSLDVAGRALGLPITKDKAGHALMLRMCRPRSFDPFGNPVWWHQTDTAKLRELARYCLRDVDSEAAIDAALPDPPSREIAIWALDQRMNRRGVCVDSHLVAAMTRAAEAEQARLNQSLLALTGGAVTTTNAAAKMLAWLHAQGCQIPNLQRATVQTWVKTLPEDSAPRIVLETRLDAARASTAKLRALEAATCGDGRVKGMLRYYGAGRTGRWSGAGGAKVQPQNLPRGTIKDVAAAIRLLLKGRAEGLDFLFEDGLLGIIASCLRGCFVAAPGKLLVCADFAQIEARVIAWLAGQQNILDVFASGEDVYVYTARRIGSDNRTLGKVCVLGLGFGMGANKFVATAATYGLKLDPEVAEGVVYAWRDANPFIVQFWYDLDRAMRSAIASPVGTRIPVGRVAFVKGRTAVGMELPSGRMLFYRNARIEPDPYTGRDAITFDGIDQKTKQWGPIRTYGGKLAENATQAVARDVMADALLDLDARHGDRLDLLLTVHDELIGEADEADAPVMLDAMLAAMRRAPAWAPGLPVGAEGWIGPRYKKG